MPRLASIVALALSLVPCCRSNEDGSRPEGKPDASTPAPVGVAPQDARASAPMELPSAVPLEASALVMLRVSDSLFTTMTRLDPFGLASGGMQEMRADLDAFLASKLGMSLLDAHAAAAFMLGRQDFALVVVGVEGEIKAPSREQHEGVALHEQDELRMARVDDLLLVGTPAAVKAAITASKDEAKSARSGVVGALFGAHTRGASMAFAVDVARLPEELAREIPEQFRVERVVATLGSDGVMLRAEGTPDQLESIASTIRNGLQTLVAVAEEQRRRVLESDTDVVEGLAAIAGAHYTKAARERLTPKVEGGALTLTMPLNLGDPALLTGMAGMAASIAIPAFTKYVRRSKTSEARVQLAKMFDAASAYFNAEHTSRGGLTTLGREGSPADPLAGLAAAHGCPNDGREVGEAGITPPLAIDCAAGPGGRCTPSVGGEGGPGHYSAKLWTDNAVWDGLNFQQETPHAFHYNFKWSNGTTGFGTCQFTAQAFGDLDGDGVFSTFERSGAADHVGVNAAGLYIDLETE
jgi:hypothetical protein